MIWKRSGESLPREQLRTPARIMEALAVLVNQQPEELRDAKGPLKDVLDLSKEIAEIKEHSLARRVGRLRTNLQMLKEKYPEQHKQLMNALR